MTAAFLSGGVLAGTMSVGVGRARGSVDRALPAGGSVDRALLAGGSVDQATAVGGSRAPGLLPVVV